MKTINTYINEKLRLTSKRTYTCQPKSKDELQQIILQRIKNEGNECDLNDIDVSKIKNMSWLLDARDCAIFKDFNGDVSMWDVSNVEDMYCMFCDCKKFNCDISKWNVSKVKDMGYMFHRCEKFNCDISRWDVSNVEYMQNMFTGCYEFDCGLSKWNVSNVKDMYNAFNDCPTTPTWYKWYK